MPLLKGLEATIHAIVVINYFTKWVKVEALSKIIKSKTTDFIWKNIMCSYGIPYALVVDNVMQFDNNNFKEFYRNLGIELKFCSKQTGR